MEDASRITFRHTRRYDEAFPSDRTPASSGWIVPRGMQRTSLGNVIPVVPPPMPVEYVD